MKATLIVGFGTMCSLGAEAARISNENLNQNQWWDETGADGWMASIGGGDDKDEQQSIEDDINAALNLNTAAALSELELWNQANNNQPFPGDAQQFPGAQAVPGS